ncbi:asparaginase [Candidatus Vallotia tarda]|uniref:Probable L-asparaginase periplasmic n=1 Tax=Candidatus Vallotiella hemipterorum TaxID=1177213 RepID=A0A916JTM6_9BURK|nr:asparaginase [Candidatus Vallotia tarda]CAG7602637.1 Probable L-asparaginase periplasmic [Candidatus Vallotia tarda]
MSESVLRQRRPTVAILATGGTIAGEALVAAQTIGYTAGVIGVDRLLSAVPELDSVAAIRAEQVASIDSKDLDNALWIALTHRVNILLAQDDIDGLVIMHGTDTLEETAYWLHLTVSSEKPVVLTAAMRPFTALSADGALNLFNAVTLAAYPDAAARGVLVAFANRIHGARDITKVSTYAIDAFASPESGVLGWVHDKRVEFQRRVTRTHTIKSVFRLNVINTQNLLPVVQIVVSHAGVEGIIVDALVNAGTHGIVVAGTGNGSIHATLQKALVHARTQSVSVVRSSRVGSGHVMHNAAAPDDILGLVSAGTLNPYKARILLMLSLAHGWSEPIVLQSLFDRY